MRNPVLIARSDPDRFGRYMELYMTGFKDGPAYGFAYAYDPRPSAKKNRVKKRLSVPLYVILEDSDRFKPAVNENLAPSLWNPNDASPMREQVDKFAKEWFKNVRP
jgi:hypothetical protein